MVLKAREERRERQATNFLENSGCHLAVIQRTASRRNNGKGTVVLHALETLQKANSHFNRTYCRWKPYHQVEASVNLQRLVYAVKVLT